MQDYPSGMLMNVRVLWYILVFEIRSVGACSECVRISCGFSVI